MPNRLEPRCRIAEGQVGGEDGDARHPNSNYDEATNSGEKGIHTPKQKGLSGPAAFPYP